MTTHFHGNHRIGKPLKKRPPKVAPEEITHLIRQGCFVDEMNGNSQYRINGELDIYPKGKKWHDLNTGLRGTYEEGNLIGVVLNFQWRSHAKLGGKGR